MKTRMIHGKQGRYKLETYRLTWIKLSLTKHLQAIFQIKRNVKILKGQNQ